MTLWSPLRLHDGGPCPVGEDDVVKVLFIPKNIGSSVPFWVDKPHRGWERDWATVLAYQVALPEPRDMQVPWHVLPPEYRWAARDEDGEACAFAAKPEKLGSMWRVGEVGRDYIRIDQLVGYDPGTKPWDQSLIERPEGV